MSPSGMAEVPERAADLVGLVRGLGRPRVLVVGDLMLDEYVSGDRDRANPESAAPLLRARRGVSRAGGAANVGLALARLGAEVALAGVVGDDRAGDRLRRLLGRRGLGLSAVATDPGRPTTRKRRYVAAGGPDRAGHLLRVDVESREPLAPAIEARVAGAIEAELPGCDIVLVSDYDKGVATPSLLRRVIARAASTGLRVLVDPPRLPDFARYRGATCLTPNRAEAAAAAGLDIDGPERAFEAGGRLLLQTGAEAIVVTLDAQGMALIRSDGSREHHPARPRAVRDTAGAGDAVLGVLGLCLASGADYGPAVALGNVAGGLCVERWGVAPPRRSDLLGDLLGPARIAAPKPRA